MNLGVLAHLYGKQDADDIFKAISQDGWDSMQLTLKKAIVDINENEDINNQSIDKVKQSLNKNNLSVSVLGCYVEPSSLLKEERENSTKNFLYQILYAKQLGAHCIATETSLSIDKNAQEQKEMLLNLKNFLEKALVVAEDNKQVIALEMVQKHVLSTPEIAVNIIKEMQSPYLKLILDPVNLLAENDDRDINEIIDKSTYLCAEHLVAVHLKAIKRENGIYTPTTFENAYINLHNLASKLPQNIKFICEELAGDNGKAVNTYLRNNLV